LAVLAGLAALPGATLWATAPSSIAEGFRQANDAARGGDYVRALAEYRRLAAAGGRGAALYWNWAQVAQAQGSRGDAVWALLQAREYEPGDAPVARGLERLREELNLDPQELNPDSWAQWRRWARYLRLDLAAVGLMVLSIAVRLLSRGGRLPYGRAAAWACLGLGLLLTLALALAARARPVAVVLHRDVALFDAASPSAEPLGTLREGEVVPVLARSAGYLRVEDSAGARGWARDDAVVVVEETP
jgi:hypothetical protein